MEESLIFFNKDGNSINLNYNESWDRYEGKLYFDPNSNDTFRTITLNTFERIDPFDYQLNNNNNDFLYLNKFQLFNEYGIDYTGNSYNNESVLNIEPVNNDSNFYSKWIYGNNFEAKFPLGSEIRFNQNITEFSPNDKTYTVVGRKKGAIMIISNVDNNTYNNTYSSLPISSFNSVTITGINAIQIRKYIDNNFEPNLSDWSEPFFYDKIFEGQKISIVNSTYNDQVVTVTESLQDNINYTYVAPSDGLTSSFIVQLTLLTDLPVVYQGNLTISGTMGTLEFSSEVPELLQPGVGFKIGNSLLNTNSYQVDNIPNFDFTPGTLYATGSQVMWNGRIYESLQSYTQSVSTLQESINFSGSNNLNGQLGNEITPENTNYWTLSNSLPVSNSLINESLVNGQVYLTTNVLTFEQEFDTNSEITIASSVENYQDDLAAFNIDYTYDSNNQQVVADLNYSSKYAEIDFYYNNINTSPVTQTEVKYERVIEVEETLTPEKNQNYSENISWDIVFTDLDEFGLRVTINGVPYYIDTVFIFNGVSIDLEKTIDKTLRAWLDEYLNKLLRLGIIPELKHTGFAPSSYVNTINLSTTYPNVPINFNVQVGTTANYYIEHSYIVIYELGNILTITVNGISLLENFDTDIKTTLSNWVTNHQQLLLASGIIAEASNQIIYFRVLNITTNLTLTANLGVSFQPGEKSFRIVKQHQGNEGNLITANEVVNNGSDNFEEAGFATGQILSINNSYYTLNNQEYNVLFLDPDKMILSYQGPFWGNTQSDITSGFLGYAFDDGFGFDPNANNITTPITPTFSSTTLGTGSNLIDITYIQPVENIYTLGSDIQVFDATGVNFVDKLLTGISSPIKMEINPVSELLYALTENVLYEIDPILETITGTTSLPYQGCDLDINDNNGDIYITYNNNNTLHIVDASGVTHGVTLATASNYLEFDPNENLMFVAEVNNNQISEIDGDNRNVVGSYIINGVKQNLFYNPFNNEIYGFDNTSLFSVSSGSVTNITGVTSTTFSSLVYNPVNDNLYISTSDDLMYEIDGLNNIVTTSNIDDYGYLLYNNFDGNIYIGSQKYPRVGVYSTLVDIVFLNVNLSGIVSDFIYNPEKKNLIATIPSTDEIVELTINTLGAPVPRSFSAAFNNSFYNQNYIGSSTDNILNIENNLGTLSENYEKSNFLLLKTREYIRRPRANFESDGDPQVEYIWKWVDDQTPEIFLYDFTGDHLENTGAYAYTGEKPLTNIYLNREPNRDLLRINDSTAQQTIFDALNYQLDYIDSSDNFNFVPTPIQCHLGFNSNDEGVKQATLQLIRREDIKLEIILNNVNNNILTLKTYTDQGESWGELSLNTMSTITFTDANFKAGQLIKIFFKDNTNDNNQYTSKNNGRMFQIRNVYLRHLVVDFIDDILEDEVTEVSNYPEVGVTTYLDVTITVIDKVIGNFNVSGQTEIEDIRYKIELSNTGKNINPEDTFIFKDYDINEQGIDWTYLNRKRKEMLLVRADIFDYIGSYKSIINAINYFGYNDLELSEYYRNVNRRSDNFNKLVKLEIPDIFNPNSAGWTEVNNLNVFPNAEYEATNLFNLSYRITDTDGNFVLNYTLDEVLIKLMGLKKWLEKNVIPISHNILDITGRADVKSTTYIYHDHYDVEFIKSNNSLTPIDVNLKEAYILPVNSGSTVFNVNLELSASSDIDIPDYYNIKIRTYQIYPDWEPFKSYNQGDEIRYLGQLYESVTDNNKTNNPKEFEEVSTWRSDQQYLFGQQVEYNQDIFQYQVMSSATQSGTASATFSSTPPYNNSDWFQINKWKPVDLKPVQVISEFRLGDNLDPYNFTVDANIDPYVTVEVTSDNGYGQNYTAKTAGEIRLDALSNDVAIDIYDAGGQSLT